MGELVVTEFVSIDGVMEAPGGEADYRHAGWTFDVADEGQYVYKLEELMNSEALLLGRVTYESFAGAWPERTDEQGFADRINSMPKYVVSSTLQDPEWQNTTVVGSDPEAAVTRLKEEVDGQIVVHGSRMLVHELLEKGLVDELRLMIFPVILGSGARAFPETEDKIPLKLAETRAYGSVVVQVYRRPEKE